jgi:hypothetical protein
VIRLDDEWRAPEPDTRYGFFQAFDPPLKDSLQMPAGHVLPGGRAGQVHQTALDARPVPPVPVLVL